MFCARFVGRRVVLVALGGLVAAGCGDDSDASSGSGAAGGSGGGGGAGGRPDQTGAACETPSDCYPGVANDDDIQGEVLCLDRVRDGYCTHQCQADDDCCAVEGECDEALTQVCSPFESTNQNMCFLSCEKDDIVAFDDGTQPADDNEYCQRRAGRDFICRSSGGGSANRKVCVPGDCGVGASCADNVDCANGLTCILALTGGYCGVEDCTADSDCPTDSHCVDHVDGNYCLRSCASDSDCSFCRAYEDRGACTTDVTFVDGISASVCDVP